MAGDIRGPFPDSRWQYRMPWGWRDAIDHLQACWLAKMDGTGLYRRVSPDGAAVEYQTEPNGTRMWEARDGS